MPKKDKGEKKIALVIFELVQDAMQAEEALKRTGYEIQAVAPPPEVRTGCDLAILIDATLQVGIERALRDFAIPFIGVVFPKMIDLRPLDILREFDYGDWMMVRCGNMKVVFEMRSGMIVNVSGGGCSDVPNLVRSMMGKRLGEAPAPRTFGYSLCAYTCDKAYHRALEIWQGVV